MTGPVRRRVAVPCLAALLALPLLRAGAEEPRIEAETGRVDNPLCAGEANPGEVMAADTDDAASGGGILFFPAGGCRATFAAGPVRRLTGIRFYASGNGQGDPHCGHFELSGGVLAATPHTCVVPGVWTLVPVHGTAPAGPFTLIWHTGEDTPTWVNAMVDFIEAA